MRTVLAALCLVVVALLAVTGASYVTGYLRLEFDNGPPVRLSEPHELAPEPVADAPEAVTDAPDEPGPVRIVVPHSAAPTPPVPVTGSEARSEPPAKAGAEPAPAAPPAVDVPPGPAPRIVGGPGITPGPVTGAPLQREAIQPAAAPPEASERWTMFRRVVVVQAGELDLGTRRVALAGIEPVDPQQVCRLAFGTGERPCSVLALRAMRQRVRSLGVECELAGDSSADPAEARCRIGRSDLALWLLAQGWARAAPDAPADYGAAEAEARCAQKGMWRGAAPPADCAR